MPTKIEWCDETWNPVTGCYGPDGSREKPRRCFYCYAYRMAKRLKGRYGYPSLDPFMPCFHDERLFDPFRWKKSRKIFVCSMADLFGSWVDSLWITRVINIAFQCPHHIFLFLTKNPERYMEFSFPENCWLGATATDYISSYYNGVKLASMIDNITFLSYEPLLTNVFTADLDLWHINWLIIGAITGPAAAQYVPQVRCVTSIIEDSKKFNIPVFMKNNLKPYYSGDFIQEFPVY